MGLQMDTKEINLSGTNLTQVLKLPFGKATKAAIQIKCVSGTVNQFQISQRVSKKADEQVVADHVSGGVNDFAERTTRIPEMYGPSVGPGALTADQSCDIVLINSAEEFVICRAKGTSGTVVQLSYRMDND